MTDIAPMDRLSDKGYALIINFEVGGKSGYDPKPEWPGYSSGITIGIGYDLGYNSFAQFQTDWGDVLPPDQFDRLKVWCGRTPDNCSRDKLRAAVSGLRDIRISWENAQKVYQRQTIPRFVKLTLDTFPGAADLKKNGFSALLSIVFNRGSSLDPNSDRRREMVKIHDLIKAGRLTEVPAQIRAMRRLWPDNPHSDGDLYDRRTAEADLWAIDYPAAA